MIHKFISPPKIRSELSPVRAGKAVQTFLSLRRSTGKLSLTHPGPTEHELNSLLRIASRVPDHRALNPWRFVVISGDNRHVLGQAFAEKQADTAEAKQKTASAFLRAPVVICVVSSPKDDGRTPKWEQELSVGAVCYNLLLAANSAGWAGCWLTEWMAYDSACAKILGLDDRERVAGFIYLGTAKANPQERRRPHMPDIISHWADSSG